VRTDVHSWMAIVSVSLLGRHAVAGTLPSMDSAGVPIDVREAEFLGEDGRVVATGTFHEPTIDDDLAILVIA